MLEIAIVTNILPHYRYGVHRALSENGSAKVTTYAGRNCIEPIRLMTVEEYSSIGAVLSPARILRLTSKLNFTLQPRAIIEVIKTKPDAVVVQGGPYEITSWILLLWGKIRNVPILPWTIGLQTKEQGIKWRVRRMMFDLAPGLLVYGDYSKKLLVQNDIDPEKIHVIYNSLDMSKQIEVLKNVEESSVDQCRVQLGIPTDEFCFCFIGRIVERKRLNVAIDAIRVLKNRGIRVHLILIGDGDDVERLKQQSSQLGISNLVHFVGSIYEEEQIAPHMMLCLGSIIPEAGLPIIHPMAYGLLPIISDDIERHGTEWEAVEEGKTGAFFRDNDPESLADTLERCVKEPETSRKIGSNAQSLAYNRYDAKSHADRIVQGVSKFVSKFH